MTKLFGILFIYLCLAVHGFSQAADSETPQLPDWQVLEYEEKAFWATARSRLEILPAPGDTDYWELTVQSSVVSNSEEVQVTFDPTDGRVITRSRLSRGKEQRLKSYRYETEFIVRERRNPGKSGEESPRDWPVTSQRQLAYPDSAGDSVVTSPYLLLLLAQRVQAQGPDTSLNVLVHTDLNIYHVRLTTGTGIPVNVDYKVSGGNSVRGVRETLAVALQVSPAGTPLEDNDFELLGLREEIILFFDRHSGLPLQIRGIAPRIGATEINLKSVTLRDSAK